MSIANQAVTADAKSPIADAIAGAMEIVHNANW